MEAIDDKRSSSGGSDKSGKESMGSTTSKRRAHRVRNIMSQEDECGIVSQLSDDFLESIADLPIDEIKKQIRLRSKEMIVIHARELRNWEDLIDLETDVFKDVPNERCKACQSSYFSLQHLDVAKKTYKKRFEAIRRQMMEEYRDRQLLQNDELIKRFSVELGHLTKGQIDNKRRVESMQQFQSSQLRVLVN